MDAGTPSSVDLDKHFGETKNEDTADDEQISSKTGFLTKKAISSMDAFANWKQRFFVLAQGRLSYYKQGSGIFASSKDDIAHLKGEIILTPDTIVRKSTADERVNCFEVVTPDKRLVAQGDSTAEMEEWIKAIRSHVNALRRENSVSRARQFSSMEESGRLSIPVQPDENETNIDQLKETIRLLVEENQSLREQLAQRESDILLFQRADERKPVASAAVLDLRDVRKKQFKLWGAAERGDLTATQNLLQEAVVDVNGKGTDQWTALHFAVCHNHAEVAQLLLSRGAFVNARTRERLTPLHIACRQGSLSCITVLLDAGADPGLTDQAGNAAIHAAAEGGHVNIVRELIARDVRTDVANASGSLPVHLAPIGHPIRVLLSNLDGKGGTANELASRLPASSQVLKEDIDKDCKKVDPDVSQKDLTVAFRNKYQDEMALGPMDFEFVRLLGRGAFAKVYLVRGKGGNKDKWYALKAYNKQAIVQKNQSRYIHTEKQALQACSDHPYIVTLHYAFQSEDRLFLVMEYCGGGDLLSTLSRYAKFEEAVARFYIGQIILAIAHLHSKNIVFRDLKPENVVMDLDGNCLLTDFGISKEGIEQQQSTHTFCGSPMYLAPEMLSRSGHGPALDWYSVGALLFELLTSLPPFYTSDKHQLFQNIMRGNLKMPDYLSNEAKSLLHGLLHRDPKLRLGSGPGGAKDIMKHPFFRNLDWKALYEKRIPPPIKPNVQQSATGMPDISNFPTAFTDQAISDIERGLQEPPQDHRGITNTASYQEKEKRLFKDFDFQPHVALSPEAQAFEKLAVQTDTRRDKANPDVDVVTPPKPPTTE